jgi:hypothetical protein
VEVTNSYNLTVGELVRRPGGVGLLLLSLGWWSLNEGTAFNSDGLLECVNGQLQLRAEALRVVTKVGYGLTVVIGSQVLWNEVGSQSLHTFCLDLTFGEGSWSVKRVERFGGNDTACWWTLELSGGGLRSDSAQVLSDWISYKTNGHGNLEHVTELVTYL